MADGDKKTAEVHILDGGRYVKNVAGGNDEIAVTVLPDCTIQLRDVWPE
jgi:hypothetical protein